VNIQQTKTHSIQNLKKTHDGELRDPENDNNTTIITPEIPHFFRQIKPTIKFQECQQKLTAKLTTHDYPASYSEVNSTIHLDKPILLIRKSTSNPDIMYLQKREDP
jgi:hypothetical protein